MAKARRERSRPTVAAMTPEQVDERIIEIGGTRVILDTDLARVYGVPTKALNPDLLT